MPSDSASDPKTAFHALFRHHWNAGTGRSGRIDPRYTSWTTRSFLDAMGKADHSISDDTLSNWLNGTNLPQPAPKTAMLKVFFPKASEGKGNMPDDEGWREMDTLWQQAWYNTRPRRGRTASSTDQPDSAWVHVDGWDMGRLLDFRLDQPEPWNQPGSSYQIRATLRIGVLERECEHGTFALSLNTAFVEIPETSYQISEDRIVGSQHFPHDHFERAAGGTPIVRPIKAGRLDGDILPERRLAIVEPAYTTEEPLTVRVVASPSEINVVATQLNNDRSGEATVTPNKRNLLKVLIYDRCRQDGDGRAILAQRRIRRSKPE